MESRLAAIPLGCKQPKTRLEYDWISTKAPLHPAYTLVGLETEVCGRKEP